MSTDNRQDGERTESDQAENDEEEYLPAEDAAEEIEQEEGEGMEVDEDDNNEEIVLQNDSTAHFDQHTDSIFCIASHPLNSSIVVTGGGDDVAYVFDASVAADNDLHISKSSQNPLLPREWESEPASNQPLQSTSGSERPSLVSLQKLDGHTDSVNAVAFTNPQGEYILTAGLDGKLRSWQSNHPSKPTRWRFIAETSEVPEINWVAACPCKDATSPGKNVVAMGANDGSVWVYRIDASDKSAPMQVIGAFYSHTASCTAGAWTPDGQFLATVSEDSNLHVWDVFGSGQAVVSLTSDDQRFHVEGGLYSVAINPAGTLLATGGAGGNIRVIGLPAGQILASLQVQSDGVETLSFSSPPLNLLAAGSVDGSIALFDTAHRFAVRRHIKEAHEEHAVVKIDFLRQPGTAHVLTTGGMDGVIRRWDVRGGTTAAGQGFMKEWRGHRGDGEGGGVLGFVQTVQSIITAGDDGVSLAFTAD